MLSRITRPVEGGDVHLVRLVQRGDRYAFEPAEIQILPGDVIRFVMVGGQPESVVFDTVASSPEVAEYVRGHDMSEGVLLTEPGDARDFRFDEAPPGRYPFHSIPHAGQGMRGTVIVRETS